MKGVFFAGVIVAGLAIAGWQIENPGQSPKDLPDMPALPVVTPAESPTIKTRRLEVVDEKTGEVGMVLTVEGGISYITVRDGNKQRKVNLTSASKRL